MTDIKAIAFKLYKFIFRKPTLPRHVSQYKMIQQAVDFFNLPQEEVIALYKSYKQFHVEQQYELRLGERKTLCFEEAFLLYLCVQRITPKRVVEIGTQHGKSTRRIIDILQFTGNNKCGITCFDIDNQVKYFSPEEANLEIFDVTNHFKDHVLLKLKPDLIYLDAHPYWLLYHVLSDFLEWSQSHPSILAIHDCSPKLYKSHMEIHRTDVEHITGQTGVWERHVLSDVFQVPNKYLDDFKSPMHRLKIFSTPHGLAIILPNKAS